MTAFIWHPWNDPAAVMDSGAVSGAVLLAILILIQAVLVPSWRPVGPIVLLLLTLVFLALKAVTADTPGLQRPFSLAALVVMSLGLARIGFVLIFHGLFHFLHRDLPKIALDVTQTLVYLLAIVTALAAAGVEPVSLLTGSAVATAVLGLALKDTLGNLFAGMAIQAQRPFEIGDWIQFDDDPTHIGRVTEINWRATTAVTLDEIEVIVPNGTLGAGQISNFTKPLPLSRRSLYVHAPYDVPPRQVHRVILTAIGDAWGVLKEPPPSVVTNLFDDRGVQYWVRFFTVEFGARDRVDGGVRDCIWYALSRAGITIPGPLRTVTLRTGGNGAAIGSTVEGCEMALRALPLFADLSDGDVHELALLSRIRLYAPSEVVFRQDDPGDELFVILRGRVNVSAGQAGSPPIEVTSFGAGDIFGEISMTAGARRIATVTTAEECELLTIGPDEFRRLLAASPDLAKRVHQLATERKTQLDKRLDLPAPGQVAPTDQRNFLVRFLDQLLSGSD